MTSQEQTTGSRGSFAAIIVRLAGLWLLAGAVAKLFLGTPKDLPELVRNLSPFGIDLTFHLVIGVELAIVCLAFLKPRRAWPVVIALFAFFDYLLVTLLLAGEENCGCFGATIKVSPWVMLGVDSVLLISLLVSRPWSSIRGPGLPIAAVAAGAAVSFALPWVIIPSSTAKSTTVEGQTLVEAPRYVIWEPEKWVNRSIYEIEDLTRWIQPEAFPTDGRVVFWRQSCEHCAAHLRAMAEKDDPTRPVLLIQIRDDMKSTSLVDLMPRGAHVTTVELPENQEVFLETPWELRVEGGTVTAALNRKALDEGGG
ncbi:MAG: MauE/DoxX family redox-associated membrane protein [Planctomycetota bacterium]